MLGGQSKQAQTIGISASIAAALLDARRPLVFGPPVRPPAKSDPGDDVHYLFGFGPATGASFGPRRPGFAVSARQRSSSQGKCRSASDSGAPFRGPGKAKKIATDRTIQIIRGSVDDCREQECCRVGNVEGSAVNRDEGSRISGPALLTRLLSG